MERGLRKILLTRYALFDEVAPASIGPLSTFDVLICDRPLPADYATHCRNGSVNVITLIQTAINLLKEHGNFVEHRRV